MLFVHGAEVPQAAQSALRKPPYETSFQSRGFAFYLHRRRTGYIRSQGLHRRSAAAGGKVPAGTEAPTRHSNPSAARLAQSAGRQCPWRLGGSPFLPKQLSRSDHRDARSIAATAVPLEDRGFARYRREENRRPAGSGNRSRKLVPQFGRYKDPEAGRP